ncbi:MULTISPECIES: hypothetical protein [Kitasatospora]|uniref:Lipoprotein n=1 Tax=Kitasatospora setae (strain ATCC 33774 / DSM 43861 / JCM 3304 / KCC A-0304 / NBRC 14216 / KM-6054) TaxID=452652 RepID=E4N9I0_KITSK|nr:MULTISPECIES: hypothetical protein [Kitasatospora]BAJ27861.1 hypothetical protein KSE_20380 [Kitasatospora setae KM-6054]
MRARNTAPSTARTAGTTARTALAALGAALLLAACGTGPHSTPVPGAPAGPALVTAGPEVRPATGAAAEQAARVAAAWPGSAARQAWERGYYPLDAPEEWLPAGAFHSGADKAAYLEGRFDLRAALPVSVADTAEVRFADGGSLVLPQRSAKDAYDWLTRAAGTCHADCDARLTVTAVRPGSATVTTSRGRATIPTWEFTVTGYDEPFRYPAVLPQQPPAAPDPSPTWSGDGLPAVLRQVSADGLVLTAGVAFGCATVDPGTVYETDQAVVLIGRATPRTLGPNQVCDASLTMAPVEFRLARPLGTRVVLGLADGRPQIPVPTGGFAK